LLVVCDCRISDMMAVIVCSLARLDCPQSE
jgi:hypothetical protein